MKNSTPISSAMVAAVLTAFTALYLSTESPFVLLLPVCFLASLLLTSRFARDAGGIWGVRLLIYSALAILGRTPTGAPSYFVDAQAFTTAGLIAGGELCLQAFRRPPAGARFDPWIVSLAGVIFLIACNTNRFHIWFLAPLFMVFLLLSLVDLRPQAAPTNRFASLRRVVTILIAVTIGAGLHQSLWAYRGSIMALGARLIAAAPVTQGGQQGGSPQLSNSFGGNTSTARLMRIKGTLKSRRLRAASYERYVKGNWGPRLSRREPFAAALPQDTGEEYPNREDVPRSLNDAQITLLRETRGTLFAPLNAHAVMPKIGESFNWDRLRGPLKTEEPVPVSYYITNSKKTFYGWEVEQGPLCVSLERPNKEIPLIDSEKGLEAMRALLLEIPPEIDPKVIELAREITKNGRTQPEKAAQIIYYLLKNNPYSLNFMMGEGDPISDFVLNKRPGHCQYFASASVMMLRAVGIPARYASGYYAEEIERDGSIIVRGRDAHAWTEAYLDKIGWVSLDATPPTGRADPNVNPLPFYQPTLERAEDLFTQVRAWFSQLTQLQIGGIVLVIVTLWSLERARQKRFKMRRQSTRQTPPPELAPLARRFERVLAKRGITPSQNRPWSENVPEEIPERRWIDGYNRARFDESSAENLRELERELRQLEKSRPQ